jgi:hypothetical protein
MVKHETLPARAWDKGDEKVCLEVPFFISSLVPFTHAKSAVGVVCSRRQPPGLDQKAMM